MKKIAKIPRGIRNNNPLNIRISANNWKGKITDNRDGDFEQFIDMEHGIRAAYVCIRTYIWRYHINTPKRIILRWAPPHENNCEAYVINVCGIANLDPNETINISDKEKLIALVFAMAYHECGRFIPQETCRRAWDLL